MANSEIPLVSCIMPTCDRRHFIAQSIRYFLRQDYPRTELIIYDDGHDSVQDLVPHDERIRYFRDRTRQAIGAKRNFACEMSRGELITHWDDDDWMAPDRLSRQVAALERTGKDVCGASQLLYYAPSAGQAWIYRRLERDPPGLCGPTLLYRKSVWARHRFPEDLEIGEDERFVRQIAAAQMHIVTDGPFCVGIVHGRNAAAKSFRRPRWERQPLEAVTHVLSLDRGFYVNLRRGTPLPAPAPAARSVTLVASFMVYDGYGSMAEYMALGMEADGARVNPLPLEVDLTGTRLELRRLLERARPERGAPLLYFSWPRPDFGRFAGERDLFVNTMWEASRLPRGWANALNAARAVIVPTTFVHKVCRDSGVTVPIEVVPQGIAPEVYHDVDRPAERGLTTLIVATFISRKHTREGIAAWHAACGDDPDARLIIKSRFQYGNYEPQDPRIRFIDANQKTQGIADLYAQADVLLALGNEGFGLPLVEGMASGLPVIALNSEGQADVCEQAKGLLLPVPPAGVEPCADTPFGPGGVRGVPGVDDVAARLRWVARHREEARAMGRAAAAWAAEHRNVWSMGPAVLEVMEARLRAPRSLRRRPTMWVPSLGTPCGIAEYAASLGAHVRRLALSAAPPDPERASLIHLEHEPGIFAERELERHLTAANDRRVPVVVTEHSVFPHGAPWESRADALVALTRRGGARLRARHPGKAVSYLPHGCPTWFPPRKRRRGAVIGAFGFLAEHKGFRDLLEVLARLPGTQLLLFSHARDAETARRWDHAARGLPARRIGEFQPAEAIARRLAAEADVLVFWYREAAHASASGAARIALATGVPVLTSRTTWFEDIREATYQPDDLSAGIARLLDDTPLRETITAAAQAYCHSNGWRQTAARYQALWASL